MQPLDGDRKAMFIRSARITPPLGRFGFAKSPAGQRVALHSVAAGPRCSPEGICEQIKQGDETPRLPTQDHSQIQTPPPEGPDGADIIGPFQVWLERKEFAIELVRGDIEWVNTAHACFEFAYSFNDDSVVTYHRWTWAERGRKSSCGALDRQEI